MTTRKKDEWPLIFFRQIAAKSASFDVICEAAGSNIFRLDIFLDCLSNSDFLDSSVKFAQSSKYIWVLALKIAKLIEKF